MSFFYRFLAWITPTSTVDQAVAGLIKFAAALAEAEAAQQSKIEQIDATIVSLRDEREEAQAQVSRARRIASNLRDITA